MPARKPDTIQISCPSCGHVQAEPRTAFSTNCRACGRYHRLQEVLKPAAKVAPPPLDRRSLTCFDCGAELEVAASAESTMCKRCSHHLDLRDYRIANAVSKNFKTKGAFVIESKGFVFNTEIVAGDAIIKGRLLGRLVAEQSLTIYSTAEIKGHFKAARLVIPAANHFRWKEPIKVGAAEIGGEIVANLHVNGTIILKSTARLFGDVEAGDLVIEEGAVVVGNLRIGVKRPS
jgi:cytoskeletal protein CcmA (bactofilin family)